MAYRAGDRVKTSNGVEGKVLYTDTARGKVAVEVTKDSVGHNKGDEIVFKTNEVRKA